MNVICLCRWAFRVPRCTPQTASTSAGPWRLRLVCRASARDDACRPLACIRRADSVRTTSRKQIVRDRGGEHLLHQATERYRPSVPFPTQHAAACRLRRAARLKMVKIWLASRRPVTLSLRPHQSCIVISWRRVAILGRCPLPPRC